MNPRWNTVSMQAEVKLLSGGTPRKDEAKYSGGEIPWVSSGEMTQRRIYDTTLHVTDEGVNNGTRLVPENTVLVVVRGMSLAKEFRVSLTGRPVTLNQDLKALHPSPKVDSGFLFYYLQSQKHAIRDSSTDASHGTKKLESRVLETWPLPLPDLVEQYAVRDILSAYDDLIENNRRRIRLLEEAARLLYKEWFVHLRFPGHEHAGVAEGIPIGWTRLTLGEVINLKRGYDLPAGKRKPGTVPVVSSSGITGSHDTAKANAPGVVTGRYGTLGVVYLIQKDFWPLNTALYVQDFRGNNRQFAFHLLGDNLRGASSNKAAVPGVNRNDLHRLRVLRPPGRLQKLFADTVLPIYDQVTTLGNQISKLSQARDLLLPRLMNGEVAV